MTISDCSRPVALDRLSRRDPRLINSRQHLMYAAHLAAGLAIKAAEPKAPAWAVLTAAFLPDLFWIGFAAVGAEPANGTMFFDGWSHSVVSILIQAAVFAAVLPQAWLASDARGRRRCGEPSAARHADPSDAAGGVAAFRRCHWVIHRGHGAKRNSPCTRRAIGGCSSAVIIPLLGFYCWRAPETN